MSARKIRNRVQDTMLFERRSGDSSWACCDLIFTLPSDIYRHIASYHKDLLERRTQEELSTIQLKADSHKDNSDSTFISRRAKKYGSDPISLNCSCDPSLGNVILFYAYQPINDPLALARLHKTWSVDLDLCGKVKIAGEGINATLSGCSSSITAYIDHLTDLTEFKPLGLSRSANPETKEERAILEKRRYDFFKPTPGCRHVFGGTISIKVVEEICPLGAPEVSVYNDPEYKRGKLSPSVFHQKLKELEGKENVVVLDVRNYYESSIGQFPGAITPPIRKFSSFRDYVDRNKNQFTGKTILSYCTGGIRCEKATSYLRQSLESSGDAPPAKVLMLEGGIHNYLEWIKQEGSTNDSLWLGKNYVFDARQSLGLDDASTAGTSSNEGERLISYCQGCDISCARYVKCDGFGCHRLIIACIPCSPAGAEGESGMYCCQECQDMGEKVREYVLSGQVSARGGTRVKRGICRCERERRTALGVE
ncbi:hypothetical protein BC939DRAFT_394601 [Gamsiella multidivaricata]|uniref:uncharacterized protein n=1 Tax=Gamsiella multidivaricata TaxID=101098 RepID=UPI00221F482F|nr:uncharacterized protein BC939DRAFT_394601 [Gamsiella multidivaricata]KAI7827964.1 hypothetical protein BC939DRAFT_394601 [Gamsiella multidivaricata]